MPLAPPMIDEPQPMRADFQRIPNHVPSDVDPNANFSRNNKVE